MEWDERRLREMRRANERRLRKMLQKPAVQASFSRRRDRRIGRRKWELALWLIVARDMLALKPKKRTDESLRKIIDGWQEAGAPALWQAAMAELDA